MSQIEQQIKLFPSIHQECDQVHIDDVITDEVNPDIGGFSFAAETFQLAAGAAGLCLPPTAAVRGGVDWMRKLAFRYRRIRDVYNLYRDNVGGLLGPGKAEHWLQLRSELELITDSWQSLSSKCLGAIGNR